MRNFARRTWMFMIVFLLTATVLSAFAQHAAKGSAQNNDGAAAAASQKADKFRAPTPEELQVLTADMAKNDSTEGLVEKTTPTGAIVVDLEGRFENFSLAKIGQDGKLVLGCATTAKEAREFYAAPPKNLAAKPAQKPATDPSTWEVK